MSAPLPPKDLGAFYYGEYVELLFTFGQNATQQNPEGTPTNPGAGPFLNLTPPGGVEADYSQQITSRGTDGAFTFIPVTSISGQWTGRVYATGSGKTSRDITYAIASTFNP